VAYSQFDPTKPDPATQAGTALANSIRTNEMALRDMCIMGTFPGFNLSVSGGTAEKPAIIYMKKSAEWIRMTITWGTTGGETDNPTVIVYAYSSNSGGAWDTIGTLTTTYDANGNVTATTWS
jgi:hypothetical protein